MSILLSLAASNVKGNTKRAIVNTMFFIGYCAGCIGSPQLWTHKPRYTEGVITSIVTWCLLSAAVIIYRLLCTVDNKQRDSRASTGNSDMVRDFDLDKNGLPKTDLTDKQDEAFRYSIWKGDDFGIRIKGHMMGSIFIQHRMEVVRFTKGLT